MTGDQADSAQRNETIWVRELLEGGTPLDFNSGVTNTEDPTAYSAHPSCAPYLVLPPAVFENPPSEAPLYTGVQDYTDYDETRPFFPQYYDPADVARHLGGERLADLHRPDGPCADSSRSRPQGSPSRAT